MKVDLFDFDLPEDRIAQHPATPRDSARLLYVPQQGGFADYRVSSLPELLTDQDILVVNDTKVLPTRLSGCRGEIRVEVTLIEEISHDSWLAFAKPGKRLKVADHLVFSDGLLACVEDKLLDGRVALRFSASGADLRNALWAVGTMPLPPYIKRKKQIESAQADADRHAYQTIFADKEGAVAAPTASLHFTEDLQNRILSRGVKIERLTLHVGAGTFLPVKSDDTDGHVMHSEWAHLPQETAARLDRHRRQGGRIFAVGTTAMRTLETAVQKDGSIIGFEGETDIFITPGYSFGVVDRLMTNFHLPRSTLFMLVSAFSGLDRMKAAYAHAIQKNYRFFSYGDGSLLERAP